MTSRNPDSSDQPPVPPPGTAKSDKMSARLDSPTGIIWVTCSGFWSADQVDEHFRQVEKLLVQARRASPVTRTLVDMRLAAPQSQPVFDRLNNHIAKLYSQRDKVAVVVRPGLAKLQLRRRQVPVRTEIFDSVQEACDWLAAA